MKYKAKFDVIMKFSDEINRISEGTDVEITDVVCEYVLNKRYVSGLIYTYNPTIKAKYVRIDFEIFKFAFEKVKENENVNAEHNN